MTVPEHPGSAREAILRDHGLWEGWSEKYVSIPLGPGKVLDLGPVPDVQNPEELGFAYPLPPVEFAFRNIRKFPPPSETEMFTVMYSAINNQLTDRQFDSCGVLGVIYDHINSNRRDSPGWQRAFLQAGGFAALMEVWRRPQQPLEEAVANAQAKAAKSPAAVEAKQDVQGIHYWVIAILGRMMGTCEESRKHLIQEGAVDMVLQATRWEDDEVRECAVCSLKGIIQYPEGRAKITYQTLIECLSVGSPKK